MQYGGEDCSLPGGKCSLPGRTAVQYDGRTTIFQKEDVVCLEELQ